MSWIPTTSMRWRLKWNNKGSRTFNSQLLHWRHSLADGHQRDAVCGRSRFKTLSSAIVIAADTNSFKIASSLE